MRRSYQFKKIVLILLLIAALGVLIINAYVFSFGDKFILERTITSDGMVELVSPFANDAGELHEGAFPVAIILGASVYSDGTLSPLLEDRARMGLELYKQGYVKKILVSGDNQLLSYNEVIPIRAYLLEHGAAPEDVFTDFAGFNTYDTMYRAGRIFTVRDAFVVTQSFHLPRALYAARKVGLNAYGVAADRTSYQLKNNTREIGATVKTFLEVVTDTKPRFLGPQIPITGNGTDSLPESFFEVEVATTTGDVVTTESKLE